MSSLVQKRCVPCEGGVSPLTRIHAQECLDGLEKGWEIIAHDKKIRREFLFKTFLTAMEFVDRVADIAESENHHPDIHIFFSRVVLELSTHAIGGLSENDFILAAKIDQIMR
ncbi:MAG: 4a-hydroxytetrahydrobiopterin dehydratase [Parcubacteria group bacterium Gr01-1014_66]|nr:MAG: 4a-hydroxytetrahydrobiopterin dehydratase [Parcubacteria group bacterium Gr01-1014_66]